MTRSEKGNGHATCPKYQCVRGAERRERGAGHLWVVRTESVQSLQSSSLQILSSSAFTLYAFQLISIHNFLLKLQIFRESNSVIKRAVTFRRPFPLREKFISCAQLSGWVWGPARVLSSVYLGFFSKGKAAGAWNWPFASILSKIDKELSYILPFPLHKIWFFGTCRTNSPSFLYLWILFNIDRIPRTGNRPLTTLIL